MSVFVPYISLSPAFRCALKAANSLALDSGLISTSFTPLSLKTLTSSGNAFPVIPNLMPSNPNEDRMDLAMHLKLQNNTINNAIYNTI
mmetsp:Transcript_19289/g.26517  ORF Transcript_19289/g.26517 Transcript_19289/m.26517 type:complete len:88 (-) Transcript_19289:46-309(-)